jgi:hypothetical protein
VADDLELRRDRELLGRKASKAYEEMVKTFRKIQEGFQGQAERSDDILDHWAIYNCEIDGNNFYNGNSEMYVPIVHAAIEARKTRFLNQLFPSSGRYIDATSSDGGVPHDIVALLEDYVWQTKLRTQHIAALLRNGDVEGHYNIYVDWNRSSRWTVSRETIQPRIALPGMPQPIDALETTPEPIEGITIEEVFDQHPTVEVLHDTDVLVQPQTATSVDDALRQGGDVTVIRRLTKETLEDMLDRGEVRKGPTEELLEIYERWDDRDRRQIEKELIDSAGIKMAGGMKSFQIHEVWKVKDVPGEGRRLTKSLYAGYDLILSCRRNPFWSDRCPLISAPQQKLAGAFKGISPIKPGVADLQYYANQIAQQSADSATYSMLPIVMTDPAKNPRTATMIMNLAAVWECDPQSTRFAEFPKLWQDGLAIIQSLTQQIFQVLGVNPAMMPQSTGGARGGRRNQAEIAMEQQVDVLTTAEACSVVEENILTPMIGQWVELDHQFRDDEITVRTYGELGHYAKMESVKPLQSTTRYHFAWYGIEQSRNTAQQQQMIAFSNVAQQPAMQQALAAAGYRYNPAPILEHAAGNIFGWRMGRLVVQDARAMLAMDPELENQMLADGFDVHVHMLDQDPQHIQSHMRAMQQGDPTGAFRVHIQRHQQSMGLKQAQQMQQQAQQGGPQQQQGQPPGGPGGPPGAGGPAPGGQPQPQRPVRGPPGMIPPDQMPRAGALVFPRR